MIDTIVDSLRVHAFDIAALGVIAVFVEIAARLMLTMPFEDTAGDATADVVDQSSRRLEKTSTSRAGDTGFVK